MFSRLRIVGFEKSSLGIGKYCISFANEKILLTIEECLSDPIGDSHGLGQF